MGYIVLDTCVWIKLAQTPALHPLIAEIAKHATGKPHAIVTPDSVSIEYTRNESNILGQWERSVRGHIGNLKLLRGLVPEYDEQVQKLIAAANEALKRDTNSIAATKHAVGELLQKGKTHSHSDANHAEANRRTLRHIAPASNPKRSSTGDCLLWLTVMDLLDDHCVWFCTDNKSDFSDPKRSDVLHPDLLIEAQSKKHKLYYFIDPSKLIEHLNQTEKTPPAQPIPQYSDFVVSTSATCQICKKGQLIEGGPSPSQFGGYTWKLVCNNCGARWDTGEFIDD